MMDIVEDLTNTIEVYKQFNDDHTAELLNTLVHAKREIAELRWRIQELTE